MNENAHGVTVWRVAPLRVLRSRHTVEVFTLKNALGIWVNEGYAYSFHQALEPCAAPGGWPELVTLHGKTRIPGAKGD